MKPVSKPRGAAILAAGGLMLVTLACLCGPLQGVQNLQSTVGAAQATLAPAMTQLKQDQPTLLAQMTQVELTLTAAGPNGGQNVLSTMVGGAESSEWATGATASSQHGDPNYAASQATGAPNTPTCGDAGTAWASDSANGQETLTVRYSQAVVPTRIVIVHSFNPGSVVKVEVTGPSGSPQTVYQGAAGKIDQCPYQQSIDISLGSVTTPIDTVVISLDQSVIGDRDEIDAVELTGVGQ